MLYDMKASFEENLKRGSLFSGEIHKRVELPPAEWKKIFDYDVMRPIGVSACPLTATMHGALLCSKFGYDVITWKTIRSNETIAHDHPNLVFLVPSSLSDVMEVTEQYPQDPDHRALANSIGNASTDLKTSLISILRTREQLLPGQILIVSLYGTGSTRAEVITDFTLLAQSVAQVNVHALELNLSCPNVKGMSYKDSEFVFDVTRAVVQAVACPVIVKIGVCDSDDQLRNIVDALARAGARGISGINSIAARVYGSDQKAYFGQRRTYAGVSGVPIRTHALEWVRNVAAINQSEKYELTIFGGGGITKPFDFELFLDAGASVALTATGALFDISLAAHYAALCRKELNENSIITSPHLFEHDYPR